MYGSFLVKISIFQVWGILVFLGKLVNHININQINLSFLINIMTKMKSFLMWPKYCISLYLLPMTIFMRSKMRILLISGRPSFMSSFTGAHENQASYGLTIILFLQQKTALFSIWCPFLRDTYYKVAVIWRHKTVTRTVKKSICPVCNFLGM